MRANQKQKPLQAFILLALLSLLAPVKAFSYEITILQSSRARVYETVLEGFITTAAPESAKSGLRSITKNTTTPIYLDETKAEYATRAIKNQQPDLVLAIGSKALYTALDLPEDIRVLYLLAPGAETACKEKKNMFGISMQLPAEKQLAAFKDALPQIKNLGLVYDPGKTGNFIESARNTARINDMRLIEKQANSPKEIPALLEELQDQIDAFWLLPDPTVVNPATMEAILLFSFENRIPILAFADKYLKLGAVLSASFNLYKMGAQAGRMANNIMRNPSQKDFARLELPETIELKMNAKIAAKLGVQINTAAITQ